MRLASAITNAFYRDLLEFKKYENGYMLGKVSDQFLISGLINLDLSDNVFNNNPNYENDRLFRVTVLGEKLIKYGFQ